MSRGSAGMPSADMLFFEAGCSVAMRTAVGAEGTESREEMAQPGGCCAPREGGGPGIPGSFPLQPGPGHGDKGCPGLGSKAEAAGVTVTQKHQADGERCSAVFPIGGSAPKNSSPELEPCISRLPVGKLPFLEHVGINEGAGKCWRFSQQNPTGAFSLPMAWMEPLICRQRC